MQPVLHHGRVVELAYTSDLKSGAARIEGSIPSAATIFYKHKENENA